MIRVARIATRWALGLAILATLDGSAIAKKKRAAAPPPPKEATAQTARAIGELSGKFKWGMSHEDAMKIVLDEIAGRYEERIRKESDPFRQDSVRKEMNEQLAKTKASYIKFDGQKTGWDVSIVDHEFAHKNDESMFVIWEKDQRRFLFFHDDHLWKQFIAFNAEHPAFQGKTFDDFADLIQKRYGPAAIVFKKLRTSDDQALDHLEWPPSGDYVMWAIDLTTFYGNYCLSLMQKSAMGEIERGRKENSPQRSSGAGMVDAVLQRDKTTHTVDSNADVVDEITGRSDTPAALDTPTAAETPSPAHGHAKPEPEKPKPAHKSDSLDPLEGTSF
jgi:hypothetical protein